MKAGRSCWHASAIVAALFAATVGNASGDGSEYGRAHFADPRAPPLLRPLDRIARQQYELGQAVFNTQWVVADTQRAQRRDGLGPYFAGASCDGCHNNGARARAPVEAGVVPGTMVIQLSNPHWSAQSTGGDPHYGKVLSPAAIEGLTPEGGVEILYHERYGQYPDGERWALRYPAYRIEGGDGTPLDVSTVVKPRLAPAIFGAGLLEAIAEDDIVVNARQQQSIDDGVSGVVSWIDRGATPVVGRFGWQGTQPSIRSQTAVAFAQDMGLTSAEVPDDDCTTKQKACASKRSGGSPEVSAELMEALATFQQHLPVPRTSDDAGTDGARLFREAGCAACHRESYRVRIADGDEGEVQTIFPYTDLLLHDLGEDLADRTGEGRSVASRWRTAPLWGIGYRARPASEFALLHDGRARSIEEAILWHDGEARAARLAFETMTRGDRRTLLRWVKVR